MILEIIAYYWPRFLVSLWFAFTNASINFRKGDKRHLIRDILVLFVIACSTVAVIMSYLSPYCYDLWIKPLVDSGPENLKIGAYLIFAIFTDAISYIIPIYIFSKIIKEKYRTAATVYFMYLLVDRACMLIAISAFTYFIVLIVIAVSGILLFSKKMLFIVDNSDKIDWEPVFHYQLGLFFLMDALYGVYRVFPGINNGIFDIKNVWIDAITIMTFGFFMSFTRLNVRASIAQAQKLMYMKELQESERGIIQKFAEISEAKSGETGQHVKRVAEYSAILAKGYGLNDDEIEHIRIASMMHDIGKLLVPIEIIEKPGALTYDEMEAMKLHTTYGDEILANSNGEEIVMARTIAHQHHERWDGTGYPRGLRENEISIYAQIVSVADVYDALTSKRAYKEAWDFESAKGEILAQSGKQFSPRIVEIFEDCFSEILQIQSQYKDE